MTYEEFESLKVGDVVRVVPNKGCAYNPDMQIFITRDKKSTYARFVGRDNVNLENNRIYNLNGHRFYERVLPVCI